MTFGGMERRRSSGKAKNKDGGAADNCYKSKSCEEQSRLVHMTISQSESDYDREVRF